MSLSRERPELRPEAMAPRGRRGCPVGWGGLEYFPHVAYALDRQLRFRCVNRAWDQFASENDAPDGQYSGRIIGQMFLDGLLEPERSAWEHVLCRMLAGELPHYHEEIPCDSPVISRRIVLTVAPTHDAAGEIDGVLFVNYDVTTARQRAAEESWLAGAHTLARAAAHVMNNHLALAVGYAELLAHSPALPEHLRGLALDAMFGAQEAANALARLNRVLMIKADGLGVRSEPTIDLDRAIEALEATRPHWPDDQTPVPVH